VGSPATKATPTIAAAGTKASAISRACDHAAAIRNDHRYPRQASEGRDEHLAERGIGENVCLGVAQELPGCPHAHHAQLGEDQPRPKRGGKLAEISGSD
jgi:hypothetical protein